MFFKNMDEAFDFDKLNPVKRYLEIKRKQYSQSMDIKWEVYEGTENPRDFHETDIGELIILALYAIDFVIRENTGIKYYFYLKDDASVKNFIEAALRIKIPAKVFLKSMLEIDIAKLIYRFTCARKFEVDDDVIKQLRLNSWGREYVLQTNLLEVYGTIYNMINPQKA